MSWTFYAICCLLIHFSVVFGDSDRPLGVPPQLAALYEERAEFECLDGSKKIPYDRVNDEYCDCKDGSDEPGTSACSNGRFYCQNVGSRPRTLWPSHVNDFICDCCDGSDEWSSGVQCPNICKAQGEKAREEAKQLRQIQAAGHSKRVELAKSGAKLIDEKKADVERFRNEVEDLQALKNDLEAKKNAAEDREREAKEKHERAYDAIREEHQLKLDNELFEQIGGNTTTIHLAQFGDWLKSKGEAAAESIKEIFGERNELDIEAFRAVSGKVRKLLKTLTEKAKSETENLSTDVPPPLPSVTDISTEDPATTTPVAQTEGQSEEITEDEEDSTNEPEESNVNEDEAEDQVLRPPYDEVTQAVIDDADAARRAYEEMLKKVSELENNIRNSESLLQFEYGSDHAWASFKGQCPELSTTQYVYRLCLFDRAIQKDRNGHSEVNLGYWGRWAGADENKFTAQVYDKGQGCWNGPERSTHVDVQCGAELELVEASEPSKCEYRFVLKSPAACENPADAADHEEL